MRKPELLFLAMIPVASHAQHRISIGPEINIPSNILYIRGIGRGGSLKYQYQASRHFGVHAQAGYTFFKSSAFYPDFRNIAFSGGVSYLTNFGIHLQGDAGVGYLSQLYGFFQYRYWKPYVALTVGARLPVNRTGFLEPFVRVNNLKHPDFKDIWYRWVTIGVRYGFQFPGPPQGKSQL